ncbi:hypothetical protein E4L97_16640 [Aeromicrobium chenweiae]|nr:hypothetical protein E4L97_16640 [Aeromicrobium chenweiae]
MRQTVPMSVGTTLKGWFQRTGTEVLGWILIALGAVLWPLPGPGTIVVVAGVALLSRHYVWAQNLLGPLERKAVEAAKFGVATWPRIFVSVLGVVWLVFLGAVWWGKPDIPEFEVLGVGFGPELPAAGWGTALGLWSSAIAALVLLIYSIVRWREPRVPKADRTSDRASRSKR